jgi:hypothetical protein
MNIVDLDSRRKSRVRSQAPTVLDGSIRLSSLYLLTAPSTPEAARTEVVERTESGEAISHTEVKNIVGNARATGKRRGWSPKRWRRHRERKRARRHNTARPGEAEAVAMSTEAPTITTNASVAMYAAERGDNTARPDEAPTAPPNDIGPASVGELACLNARIGELENAKRRLEIENTRLRSEIAELRSHLKPSDGNDHIAVLARKITALMSHPVHHTDAIYKAAAEILHIAKPEAKNGKPIAISPTVKNLDVAAFRKAMALPAGTRQ